MSEKPYCVFIDIESTGTDFSKDLILEVGAVAVNDRLEMLASISNAIKWEPGQLSRATWPGMWDMHSKSGLLADVFAKSTDRLPKVDYDLARWLQDLGHKPRSVVVAGNSVGQFDIPMIKANMPHTADMLSHHAYDISGFARFAEFSGFVRPKVDMPHRALADCMIEIDEARALRRFLGRV